MPDGLARRHKGWSAPPRPGVQAGAGAGIRSWSVPGAWCAREATCPGFWGAALPYLLRVPVSGTSYVKQRFCMGRPRDGSSVPDYWGDALPSLLRVPVSGTSYVKQRLCIGRPRDGGCEPLPTVTPSAIATQRKRLSPNQESPYHFATPAPRHGAWRRSGGSSP
jgi:hypothetical protein